MSRSNKMSRRVASLVLLVVASSFVGCSTDVQMMNRSKQSREEGIRFYNDGQYADAAGSFRNAVRQDGRDYKSHYYLGASYEELKQYEQAIQAYKTAFDSLKTSLAGQEDTAFRDRIVSSLCALVARTDERGVQRTIMETHARESRSAKEYWLLARVHRACGDPDSAIQAYNSAMTLDQKDFEVAKDYGLYLIEIGQTQKADVPLRRAYRLNPQDAQVAAALRQVGVVPESVLQKPTDLIPPADRGGAAVPAPAPLLPASGAPAQLPND